jgi:hypothetical protein
MLQRCNNPKEASFKDYGGRGIKVCERWMSFENFFVDMGEKPRGKSLDRKKNDEGYTPENCRWATAKEQADNRRTTYLFEFEGKKKCLADLAIEHGLSPDCLKYRLNKGIPLEVALTLPKFGRIR